MGFSLVLFFEDLKNLLDKEGVDAEHKLALMEALINKAEKYAKECGKI